MLKIDARHFVPQSRPRLFVIALRKNIAPEGLSVGAVIGIFHTEKLGRFVNNAVDLKSDFIWWTRTGPDLSALSMNNIVDHKLDTDWLSDAKVDALLEMTASQVVWARPQGALRARQLCL